MSMVRGKLESIREVTPDHLKIGSPLFLEKDGKYFSEESGEEICVEIFIIEDFQIIPIGDNQV